MRYNFLRPLITADLLDPWVGSQSLSQYVAGSTPGSVTFPSVFFFFFFFNFTVTGSGEPDVRIPYTGYARQNTRIAFLWLRHRDTGAADAESSAWRAEGRVSHAFCLAGSPMG